MREHGDYASGRSEQVLLFSAKGPWNDETMRSGVIELAKNIEQLSDGQPWGQISCLYAESLMPPSTYAVFKKQTLIRKQLGLSAIAILIKNSDVTLTIQSQLRDVYQLAGVEYRFCDTFDDACNWLETKNLPFSRCKVQDFFDKNAF